MTMCQRSPKVQEKATALKQNGKTGQGIELSAISDNKKCNSPRDVINSSPPTASGTNGIHSVING